MTSESNATNPRPDSRVRAAYLEALGQIATDIASRVDASRLLHGVLERTVQVMGASGGLLWFLEPDQNALVLNSRVNLEADDVPQRMILDQSSGFDPKTWASGEPFFTGAQHVGHVPGKHTERGAAVPIRLAGVPVGMIQLFRLAIEPPFEPHDLEWMRDFAELAAIAVDHARLRDEISRELSERQLREAELNRQLRETRLLRQVSQAASASLEPLVVLTNICRELAGAIGVPQAAFARLADDGSHLVVVAEHRPPGVVGLGIAISLANNAVTERAITSFEPVAVFDAQNDPEMAAGRMTAAQLGIKSMLIVPIVVGLEVIGTLGLDSLEPRVFTDEDIHLARTVASAAAPALEHARLFEALKLELAERGRIEAALRASEARHRALIDAVPDAIYRLGADARIIDARIPGQSAERLIGKRLSDVLPVSIAQRALEAVRKAQQERTVRAFDERLALGFGAFGTAGNATHRDVEMRFAPISDDSVVMLERDITVRKQAERDFQEQQARFEELVDSVEGIVWEIRLHDGVPRLEYVSRRVEPLLGVNPSQLLGDNLWIGLIHPEDRETLLAQAIRAMEARQPLEIEHRVMDASGLEHWFHNRASVLLERNRAVGLRGLATDITARKQAEQLEGDRNRVLELAARGAPLDVVMGLITAMLVRLFPDAACNIMRLGRGQLELLGATGLSVGLANRLRQVALGAAGGPLGQTAVTADLTDVHDLLNDHRWSDAWRAGVMDEGFRSLASVPIRSAAGAVIGVLTMFGRRPGLGAAAAEQMVSAADLASIALEKHLLTERLEFQALHDALTGLPNRTLFADRLGVALAQAHRHAKRVALLYVDLDGFKPVNDQFGHSVGDALLREIAAQLVACVRSSDTVARLGGDEFCVILSDLEHITEAVPVALKIVRAVAAVTRLGEREVRVRASVGLVAYPDHATDADALYRLSDQAMYRAKNAGGHRLAIHDHEDVLEP